MARSSVKGPYDACFHHANQKVLMDHFGHRLRDGTANDFTNAVYLPDLNPRRGGMFGLWSTGFRHECLSDATRMVTGYPSTPAQRMVKWRTSRFASPSRARVPTRSCGAPIQITMNNSIMKVFCSPR